MSFLAKLRKSQAKLAAQDADPWCLPLERVRGGVGDDGIERITTQLLFDILQVPQRNRGSGACRRLAKLMAELGWMAVRVRGLTRGGYRRALLRSWSGARRPGSSRGRQRPAQTRRATP